MEREITVPTDLAFVIAKDIPAIAESFISRYAQVIPVTDFQKKSLGSAELLSREETASLYGYTRDLLFNVYGLLEAKARQSGIGIEYVDMTGFSEDTHYGNTENEATKHAETARSDGKNLLLEADLERAGGIEGRMYDLLHLAFGHMVQWSTDDSRMLLTKEQAWQIGYRNHEQSADVVIDMMSLYEFEAGMMAIEVLQETLRPILIHPREKDAILQYFVDYVYADRGYIIQHYRGNHESFQKFWKFGQPIPPRRESPEVQHFIQRTAVEVGLIKDMQTS